MVKNIPETKPHNFSLLLIIIGNIIPLVGVMFFGWDLAQVVVLYWVENLIIGFWNVPRILFAGKSTTRERIAMSLFFLVHYGIFCSVHGAFIISMVGFSQGVSSHDQIFDFITKGILIGAVTMFFSIGWDFYQSYIRNGDYKEWDVAQAMFNPYGHIIVIHIAIILTGFITFMLGTPIILLILLIVGKIMLEYLTKSGKLSFRKLTSKKKTYL